MNRTELQSALVAKATEDTAFRQQLIENPRQTIAEFFQINIPADVEVTVFAESPQRVCLVLPPQSTELSDSDLTGVAGGLVLGNHFKNYHKDKAGPVPSE